MKNIFVSMAILIVIITLVGCSGNTGATQTAAPKDASTEAAVAGQSNGAEQQELVVVGQEIAASLDPVKPLTSSYLRNVGAGEALFRIDAKGQTVPSLAESAKAVDPTTWEIKLRSGAKFWSGKPIDASAVIASLERSRAQDPQAQPFLKELAFSKVDDYTLQVKTTSPHVPVPLNLSYYQTLIHNAEAKYDAVDTMDLTGMYKVIEFESKKKLVLSVNESYWGTKPTLKRVVFEEISDGQTRVLTALSGRSHVTLNVPAASLSQFKNHKDVRISAEPAANTQTIYLNLSKPQLADARVRQALSWALDRQELVAVAAEGHGVPVTTWLGSNPGFPEARNAVYDKTDLTKAGQLLDEAGWKKGADGIRVKDGQPLTLTLMTWGGDKALGEALQSQWTKLGVKAEVRHGDYSLIQAARDKGEWDAFIEAWSTFGDMHTLLTGQYGPKGSANYGGYVDEETSRLLAQLKEATDDQSRRKLALQVNEQVARQAPVIALFPRPQLTAVSKKLQGFEEHFRQFENVVNAGLTLQPGAAASERK
ncbi:ABC transporter substrate-binding protein [Paenibacillus sp. YYML68]|uniref:ABC transporter substrate-binding protein n=1 Tax=Paenibacillus sp. YYML68 TaxID=2909250 RepID=UPI0024905EF3|nr:ABC transporter substrate-binding protein [Paenibacillus sp. YYML68]